MSVDYGRNSSETPSTLKPSPDLTGTPQGPVPSRPAEQDAELRSRLDRVLQSNIGIDTLLTRLKQSISSAREFSSFLKERASLEEKHYHGINRLTRSTQDMLGRPENRQGSFAFNYRELGVIHENMAKNSEEFAHSLLLMSEELQEVAMNCERGRKQHKHTGLEAEQKAVDAENVMDKARAKYFALAEQYDRVRTGERQGAKFGLKGPKSAAQQEESLLSKTENADQEYRSRVEAAQAQRHELLTSSRPQTVRELQGLIMECDAAVSMQMQKFAVLNEKLLLGNGLCVSPLKSQENTAVTGARSLREIAQAVNNQKDFEDYVSSHSGKVGSPPAEIKYEKHPTLVQPHQQHPSQGPNTFGAPQRAGTGFGSMSGPPERSDTGFNNTSGPMNYGGQTSGIISNQPQSTQSSFAGPQTFTSSTAPQLPQIGALSSSGRTSLEGRQLDHGHLRSDSRNMTGPQPQRPGQSAYSSPTDYSSPTSVNQQVTQTGHPGSGPALGAGIGRGQPPNVGSAPPVGGSMQGPYHAGRGPSLGQQNDFRPDGRGPSLGQQSDLRQDGRGPSLDFRPDGRGPSLGQQSDFRQDGRGMPVGQQNDFRPDGRGPSLGQQSDFRPDGRGPSLVQQGDYRQDGRGPPPGPQPGPQYGPSVPTHQHDPRGLPSQMKDHGPSGYNGPNTSSNSTSALSAGGPRGSTGRSNLPALRPVFGVPLDELFRRDGAAVPALVYQCVQAVDLFGLNTEGVYRVPGSAQHVMELQALFDHDSSQIDFRNRSAFYNDIASVTTLLKHFLRDLPDPLLTSSQYNSFIQAAKIEEDIVRRDSLHAIINSLPDPNYATLRTLVLHLYRVAQKSATNRMTASNLAIVFGPTLMGGHGGGPSGEIQDAGWQARVIETILNNTLQIFDDDD